MAKIFYDHLVVLEEIVAVIDTHNLPANQRQKLLATIDELFHHHMLDEILTHLPKNKHEVFLKLFHKAPHDPMLLSFLKQHAKVDIERAMKTRADKVKAEILKEIEGAKR